MQAVRDDDAICASFYRGATQRSVLPRKVMRPQYLDPAPFLPTEADGYERKVVFPLSSSAVLSRETARLRLENKSIEKRFDSLYAQAYATRVQLRNIEAAASKGTLNGSNFAAAELLKLATRIMELLAQQPEDACMRFIPDVLACLALCQVRDKRLYAAGQRLRHALSCVSRASSQARRTVFQPIGRAAGAAPPDLKWLATITDDMAWLRQAEQWDQYPLDLRWLAVASGDQSVLLHRYAWQRAPIDLRYLTVLTGDMDWLHVGAERWRSTPAEIRLRAVAQRSPLLLWPAATSSAAHIEEEAYAELRSAITESLPAVPFNLSPGEDLDISLQLRLASDRPASIYSGRVGLQKEKMQRTAKGVTAPPSLAVTVDARPPVIKTAVPSEPSAAAKLQVGVGPEKKAPGLPFDKAERAVVSLSAKTAGKLTPPAVPAVEGKKVGVLPEVAGKPALPVEKKLPTVLEGKGATGPSLQKKAAGGLKEAPMKAAQPSGAEAKTAGVTSLPRTLKSPQAPEPKAPEGKEAQAKLTAGVPPGAPPKLAPAMLAKGGGETKQVELVTKKVGISPHEPGISKAGAEAGVKQKAPGPLKEKEAALSGGPPSASKKGAPPKKGGGIKAAEAPVATTAGERKVSTPGKIQEGVTATGKTGVTPSVVTPAVDKPGKDTGSSVPSKVGGPPGKGPPPGKSSAPPPPTGKTSAPPPPTGKTSAPPPPTGKTSAPPPPAGKTSAPPPPAGKTSAPPPPEGKTSAPPPPTGKTSAPPPPTGKTSAPPPPTGKTSAPPPPTGKTSAPPPPTGKTSAPPPPEGKTSAPPPPTGKTSAPPPPTGKTSAPPPPTGKTSAPPPPTGKTSAPPPPPTGKTSAPLPPTGKTSAPPPPTGKTSAPPPPTGKTSAPPPPAGKESVAFCGDKEGGDDKENGAKEAPPSKNPPLVPHAIAKVEEAETPDVAPAQKLGMPTAKKLPLTAKNPPLNAPASKMAEHGHTKVGDESSMGSKLVVAEGAVRKEEAPLPKKKVSPPAKSPQGGTGGPTLAEKGEAQQKDAGAKPPGKLLQVKKTLGFPPKKMMPASMPTKV